MSERLLPALERAKKLHKDRLQAERERVKRVGPLIYFVQAGKYIKVGISSKAAFKGRINSLRVANPHPVRVLRVLHTRKPRRDERLFHRLLKDYHVRGEWFLITNPAILEFLGAA